MHGAVKLTSENAEEIDEAIRSLKQAITDRRFVAMMAELRKQWLGYRKLVARPG